MAGGPHLWPVAIVLHLPRPWLVPVDHLLNQCDDLTDTYRLFYGYLWLSMAILWLSLVLFIGYIGGQSSGIAFALVKAQFAIAFLQLEMERLPFTSLFL